MKSQHLFMFSFTACALMAASALAQDPSATATPAAPSEADTMAKMTELSQPGENHKLLAQLNGEWSYKVKFWMAPDAKPTEFAGSAVRKSIMGGRYFVVDSASKMEMPGADGKMSAMEFKGMGLDSYDNVKQKFISTWIDNMGTGVVVAEGTYDPASKTFTYHYGEEMAPGMKTKVRETIVMSDKDHYTMDWYNDSGDGKETKTMEMVSTRKK